MVYIILTVSAKPESTDPQKVKEPKHTTENHHFTKEDRKKATKELQNSHKITNKMALIHPLPNNNYSKCNCIKYSKQKAKNDKKDKKEQQSPKLAEIKIRKSSGNKDHRKK